MSGEITYQTELDAVEDPLDGEAGQEDHTGEEDQADVEAARLGPGLTHLQLGCDESDAQSPASLTRPQSSRPRVESESDRSRSGADWRQIEGPESQWPGRRDNLFLWQNISNKQFNS